MDFSPFFRQYEELLKTADSVFEKVKHDCPNCVTCKTGCSDCCYALFDLTLVEALYINHHFNEKFSGTKKENLITKANVADRQIYKIKRQAYKELEAGKNENDILEQVAHERIRCPLLDENNLCELYEHRPITCRFYGVPTSIGGKGYTCGLSSFDKGKKYPTVNLDMIHRKLYDISAQLADSIGSKYTQLSEMIVPISMSIVTVYNETFLGCADEKEVEQPESNNKNGKDRVLNQAGDKNG
ncbi:YkgJ family cysteine cluster protein [Desulfobacterales bacterium HSG16]|nr:YkgJ family cysteine cluster protein [Desulfobacterales bacterium HSG16]